MFVSRRCGLRTALLMERQCKRDSTSHCLYMSTAIRRSPLLGTDAPRMNCAIPKSYFLMRRRDECRAPVRLVQGIPEGRGISREAAKAQRKKMVRRNRGCELNHPSRLCVKQSWLDQSDGLEACSDAHRLQTIIIRFVLELHPLPRSTPAPHVFCGIHRVP